MVNVKNIYGVNLFGFSVWVTVFIKDDFFTLGSVFYIERVAWMSRFRNLLRMCWVRGEVVAMKLSISSSSVFSLRFV